jgi:urease accessory protein
LTAQSAFRRFPTVAVLLGLVCLPQNAHAHGQMPGTTEFAAGFIHPLLTPLHVLLLVAAGLWLGQFPALKFGVPYAAFAGVAALALAATAFGFMPTVPAAAFSGVALSAGVLVASGTRMPLLVYSIFLGLIGGLIGLDSGLESGSAFAVLKTLLGTWVSLVVCLLAVIYYVSMAAEQNKKWMDIAIRVAGSWIVAISILMLAFALRQKTGI